MDFEEYAAVHGAGLVRMAYVLTGDAQLAEDLAQITLAKVYRSWSRVDSASDPVAYGRRICVNSYLSWRRRKSSSEVVLASPMSPDARTADHTETIVDRIDLQRLLAQLNRRTRAAMVLRFYLDLSDEEIGIAISARPATVRSLIHRGLKTARQLAHEQSTPATGDMEVPDGHGR